VPLYWARYGSVGAPVLLVLHGGPGAHHDYLLPQLLALADEYELVFYDQRGGGQSKTDDREPITWRTHVRDLDQVAGELGIDPLSLVGYSWGAMLALLYAIEQRRNPHFVAPDRLALINPAPLTREYRRQFEEEFNRRQQSPEIQKLRDLFADAPELGKKALENVLRELTSQVLQTSAPPVHSAGRIGIRQGKVSELTVIAPFAPGGAQRLRTVLQLLNGNFSAGKKVGTLHDMRFVFLDNDTKLLFATAYDGEWDPYIDDFATKITDQMFRTLSGLDQLQSLNVYGTGVTAAAFPLFEKFAQLEHIYAGQTAIRLGDSVPLNLKGKLIL
jgi:pimeloyl-ACP methyl ester carboxylesterase